jgi:hypothetical protein
MYNATIFKKIMLKHLRGIRIHRFLRSLPPGLSLDDHHDVAPAFFPFSSLLTARRSNTASAVGMRPPKASGGPVSATINSTRNNINLD